MSHDFDWTEHIARLGELPPLVQLWERELVAELRRWIPHGPGLKVLEIGCSNGRWLNWFRKEYQAQTFGVDLNAVGLSSVEHFILADGLRLPLRDGVFDVVFSMGLIEHFPDAFTRQQLIAEHARVAKPETGFVWVEHPNMNLSLDLLYVKYFYDYRQGYRHYRATSGETRRCFRDAGLEILTTRWIGWILPTLLALVSGKLRKHFRCLPPVPARLLERKWFEHPLTADNYLLIGRREG